jgi:hypothetical protein
MGEMLVRRRLRTPLTGDCETILLIIQRARAGNPDAGHSHNIHAPEFQTRDIYFYYLKSGVASIETTSST